MILIMVNSAFIMVNHGLNNHGLNNDSYGLSSRSSILSGMAVCTVHSC